MTHIGHFRAVGKLLDKLPDLTHSALWIAPPTKMDTAQLRKEGILNTYIRARARVEYPGCSLCMGNQVQVREGATAVSISTRNFPNRLGQGAKVFLASAELAAVTAILGYLPSVDEYRSRVSVLSENQNSLYQELLFDQNVAYQTIAYQTESRIAVVSC